MFLGRDYLLAKEVSQPTLEHLDAEIRTILDEQEAVARQVLESHRSLLDELVEQLVAHETLKGRHRHGNPDPERGPRHWH